jgi:hypothetical protein
MGSSAFANINAIFLMLFWILECFVGYSSSSSIVNMGVE